jgi:hypothetical protein
VLIDDGRDWRAKISRTLQQNYPRAAALPLVEELVAHRERRLAVYNEHAIRRLAEEVGIGTRMVRGSELGVEGRATGLLIDTVRAVGGAAYLSGAGAGGYQEDERFADSGIELIPQSFHAPHGLSIIHALLSGETPAIPR